MRKTCGVWMNAKRKVVLLLSSAVVFQLGGCFGSITTTSTISGRDFFLNGLRGLILAPLDALIVSTVDNLFDDE